jgi:hypothetical protein
MTIDKLLTKATLFWLRTQVDGVEELEMQLSGGDRKLLAGNIPEVSLSCRRAIYQNIHLRQIALTASNIRINIGQIVKGKPLCLLEPVPIVGNLVVEESDLQASLASPLLDQAFSDFLAAIWESSRQNLADCPTQYGIDWQEIRLQQDKFELRGLIKLHEGQIYPIILRSGLELLDSHTLRLSPLQIEAKPSIDNLTIQDFTVDLGELVSIEELNLGEGRLACRGSLTVMP